MDPDDAYALKVQIKEECDCKYDCLWGRFCEIPVQCTCVNQCSGHGKCRGGFCQVKFRIHTKLDILVPRGCIFLIKIFLTLCVCVYRFFSVIKAGMEQIVVFHPLSRRLESGHSGFDQHILKFQVKKCPS